MKPKTRRCVVHVVADLPADLTTAQFSRIVEHRVRDGGGLVAHADVPFPMAVRVWPGSSKRQRRAFRKLLTRYIDLDRKHAQASKRPPTFDEATGRRFASDMLLHWDAGHEQGLFWLAHHVDLIEKLLERNIKDDANDKLWDVLYKSVEDRSVIIAEYELMIHRLLEEEVTKH
jgi:hypothetical protein